MTQPNTKMTIEEPTMGLRWNAGTLQQRHKVTTMIEGKPVEIIYEWRNVPGDAQDDSDATDPDFRTESTLAAWAGVAPTPLETEVTYYEKPSNVDSGPPHPCHRKQEHEMPTEASNTRPIAARVILTHPDGHVETLDGAVTQYSRVSQTISVSDIASETNDYISTARGIATLTLHLGTASPVPQLK